MSKYDLFLLWFNEWWTKEHANRAGIGAFVLFAFLSESIIMLKPLLILLSTSLTISSNESSMPFSPLLLLYKIFIVLDLNPLYSICLILCKSLFEITGFWIFNFLHWRGETSNKFLSFPSDKLISVTIFSLIPSSGGFVTCANYCLK